MKFKMELEIPDGSPDTMERASRTEAAIRLLFADVAHRIAVRGLYSSRSDQLDVTIGLFSVSWSALLDADAQDDMGPTIAALFAAGQSKIDVIKAVRHRFGLGLREAAECVEAWKK